MKRSGRRAHAQPQADAQISVVPITAGSVTPINTELGSEEALTQFGSTNTDIFGPSSLPIIIESVSASNDNAPVQHNRQPQDTASSLNPLPTTLITAEGYIDTEVVDVERNSGSPVINTNIDGLSGRAPTPRQNEKRSSIRGQRRIRNKDTGRGEQKAPDGDDHGDAGQSAGNDAIAAEDSISHPKVSGAEVDISSKRDERNIDILYQNGNGAINGDYKSNVIDMNAIIDTSTPSILPTFPAPSLSQYQSSQLEQLPTKRTRHPNPYISALPPKRRGKKAAQVALDAMSQVFEPFATQPEPHNQLHTGLETETQTHDAETASFVPLTTQKRILPARQRRGGPGVGSCHVDILIIETEKRAKESRPVIPFAQKFTLSTNVRLIPTAPAPEGGESSTSGSYFDKPEVKAAYLAQKAIQVPEFAPLPDDAVGGRLRARQDEEGYETSDVAYVNRHRKYEAFEKRQRRREKEKLVHEQYKLKERIEQLKGMDVTAFGVGGEARRREMLDTAIGLQSRYAILLPPEPKKIIHKKGDKRRGRSEGMGAGTTTGGEDGESEEEFVQGRHVASHLVQPPPPPEKITRPERGKEKEKEASASPVESRQSAPSETRAQAITVALEASVIPNESKKPFAAFNGTTRRSRQSAVASASATAISGGASVSIPTPAATPLASVAPTMSTSTSAEDPSSSMMRDKSYDISFDPTDSLGLPPPKKRQRLDSLPRSLPEAVVAQSVLLQVAARKAAQPTARQTGRSLTAFGIRVPQEVEDVSPTYSLPEWLITLEELEQHYAERQQAQEQGV
ncbi:hypothetical protein Clacol_007517 [Clathrus columnatus]|uniref:Something about silencing protein 4 domain-containing protein n=1 Tax=Clathrus columnatus TaxID=1419009 RepID=A0AAV5ALE6_9AGAM|nr:hypothetical protein Clacol_007517 [Clathrus columnatus]